jgi:hypothetical protein
MPTRGAAHADKENEEKKVKPPMKTMKKMKRKEGLTADDANKK